MRITTVTDTVDHSLISKYRGPIMGIAILWIVLFHSPIPAPENTLLRALWYIFVSFGGGCGVNVFLILSGFGLNYSHAKRPSYGKDGAYGRFMKDRLIRIVPMYLVIAIVYYGICDLILSFDVLKLLKDVTLLNYVLDGVRTYWYIFAILIFYAAFPLLMWASDRFGTVKTHLLSLAATAVVLVLLKTFVPALYDRFEIVVFRAMSFIIGSFIGRITLQKKQLPIPRWLILVASATVTVLILALIRFSAMPTGLDRVLFIVLAVLYVYSFAILMDMIPLSWKLLSFFGKHSLEIYLIHIPCFELVFRFFDQTTTTRFAFLIVIAVLIISVIIGLAVYTFQQKVILARKKK